MFTGLLTQSAVRLRGVPVEDPYSGEVTSVDWSTPDRLPLPRVSVQPVQSDEVVYDRQTVTSRWWLWAPGHPDITALDKIEFDGDEYEIDGKVLRWPGRIPHSQLMLKYVEG